METKMKSEKSELDNLELVIESISEDLKSNIDLNTKLNAELENLSSVVSELVKNQESNLSKYETDIISIKKEFKDVHSKLLAVSFPENILIVLSEKLTANSFLLKHPSEVRVLHHHHVPKLIWVATGLWLAFTLSVTGLFVTNSKLNGYVENDIKFRHLKLDTGNRKLQIILDREDSLFSSNPDFKRQLLKQRNNLWKILNGFRRLED